MGTGAQEKTCRNSLPIKTESCAQLFEAKDEESKRLHESASELLCKTKEQLLILEPEEMIIGEEVVTTPTEAIEDLLLQPVTTFDCENPVHEPQSLESRSKLETRAELRLKMHRIQRMSAVPPVRSENEQYSMLLESLPSDRPESYLITICSQSIESELEQDSGGIDSFLTELELPSRLVE